MDGSRPFTVVSGRIKGLAANMRESVSQLIASSNAREIESVRWFTRHLQYRGVRPLALAANRLSNGMLYLIVGALFWLVYGMTAAVIAAATALAFGHLVYPVIKQRYGRRRPFRFDSSVPSLLEPLDEHSFPSGHMMSCVAVLTPLCMAVPTLWPLMLILLAIIGWARLAAGHHYPSDLLAGCLLGIMVTLPIVSLQLGYG